MDSSECTTLYEALAHVPDPRKARGQRYTWPFLLILIATALASHQRTPHAIAHWVQLHAAELLHRLAPPRARVPSEATLRRVLRTIDVDALEHHLAQLTHALAGSAPAGSRPTVRGQAIDGKKVRGVGQFGAMPHLVSLVEHEHGYVLAQTAVSTKQHELAAAPRLLAGRDLHGTVTTMDALVTNTALAQHILDQRGHYLMVVKHNQPQLYADVALLFATPPLAVDAPLYSSTRTVTKAHGRLEVRTLMCSTELCGYVDWPGVGQVLQRTCERTILKTGKTTVETTFGITSLTPVEASPAVLEQLWRGHWTIENRLHYVRDVTRGEDAGHAHRGNTAHTLAALRNAILNLLRWHGWTNIADGLRSYAASIDAAFALVGISP